jgi:hypothetical protein
MSFTYRYYTAAEEKLSKNRSYKRPCSVSKLRGEKAPDLTPKKRLH